MINYEFQIPAIDTLDTNMYFYSSECENGCTLKPHTSSPSGDTDTILTFRVKTKLNFESNKTSFNNN